MKTMILLAVAMGLSFSGQAITLEEALRLAITNSPALHASQAEEQAASTGLAAAVLWENPVLELEAEGIGGDPGGTGSGEYSAVISQTFPMFGKTEKRRVAAQKSVEIQTHRRQGEEIALAVQVREAFAEVLAQQEFLAVRLRQENVAREFIELAEKHYAAGGAPKLSVVQAELSLEEILIARKSSLRNLDSAKQQLASLLGVTSDGVSFSGNLYRLQEHVAVQVASSHPALKQLRAHGDLLRAEASVAGSRDIPDLTLGAGVKYDAADDVQTYVISASMPLPLWRKGRLERVAALLQAEAMDARREQLRRDLQQRLDRLTFAYWTAVERADHYENNILPKAEQACELSRQGVEAGLYSWRELLTVQQNLVEIQLRHIEAVRDAQKALAELSPFIQGEIL